MRATERPSPKPRGESTQCASRAGGSHVAPTASKHDGRTLAAEVAVVTRRGRSWTSEIADTPLFPSHKIRTIVRMLWPGSAPNAALMGEPRLLQSSLPGGARPEGTQPEGTLLLDGVLLPGAPYQSGASTGAGGGGPATTSGPRFRCRPGRR